MNEQRNQRERNAIQHLQENMAQIQESDIITSAMIGDWILNSDPDEVDQMPIDDWKDLIKSTWRQHVRDEQQLGDNVNNANIQVPYGENDYDRMLDFFKVFVRAYHGPQGGGKRRHHKRTKTHKKTRRGKKKTRKHK